jgi:predicted MPP superfamily phosphohydrolase
MVLRGLSIDQRSQLIRFQIIVFAELIIFLGSRYVWRSFQTGLQYAPGSCSVLAKSVVFAILVLAQLSFVIQHIFHAENPTVISMCSFIGLGIMIQFIVCQFCLNRLAWIIAWTSTQLQNSASTSQSKTSSVYHTLRRYNFSISVLFTVTISLYGIHGGSLAPIVKTVEIPVEGLASSMDRFSVAVISDIHLGPTVGRTKLQYIVNTINQLNADIVAVVGDLTDGSVERTRLAAEPLAQIKARHGKFFVSGNHEYHTGDVVNWFAHLSTELGFTVLHNSHINITDRHGGFFYLAGTDDIDARMMQHAEHGMDLDKAVGSCDQHQPIILLAHQPRAAKLALDSEYNIQLVISGHTHGGQMFPMVIIAYLVNPFYAGLYRYGNGHVYVSQGTVYWGIPMRMFSEAEITRVFLRSAGTLEENSLHI